MKSFWPVDAASLILAEENRDCLPPEPEQHHQGALVFREERGCAGRTSSRAPTWGCSSSALTFSSPPFSPLHPTIQHSLLPIEFPGNMFSLIRERKVSPLALLNSLVLLREEDLWAAAGCATASRHSFQYATAQ